MKRSLALLILAAPPALAQGTITYSWDVNDSGSNTATITPGQTVNIKMWATWEPDDYGFAGSIYEIRGLRNWDTGVITLYDNQIDMLTDDGELQPNNDILDIESFGLPPLFGDPWYPPPAFLYEIEWIPLDYTLRTVRVTDANHLNNDLYTDYFGTSVSYDAAPSEGVTLHIIPAPAGALLLALAFSRVQRPCRPCGRHHRTPPGIPR